MEVSNSTETRVESSNNPTNKNVERAMRSSSLKRYWHMLLMKLAATLPISRQRRAVIFQKAGVSITPNGGVRVGKVTFDSIHPEDVHIDKKSSIADGCILVTHYMDVKNTKETFAYYRGSIHIGRGVYLGSNCIVTKPITIGHGAIISAGSIINKDIPPFEVWGGVPAKFLCKRYESEEQLQQLLKEVEKY